MTPRAIPYRKMALPAPLNARPQLGRCVGLFLSLHARGNAKRLLAVQSIARGVV